MSRLKRGLWGYVAAAYLGLCILLGGASAAGAVANATIQAVGLVLIVALAWSGRLSLPREALPLAWLVGLFIVFNLVMLIPLPFGWWESFGIRGDIARELRLVGAAEGPMPLSLAPFATVGSLLWLIPAVAMFLLTMSLSLEERRRIPTVILVMAIVSMMLGVVQLISGESSPLRFYAITNRGSPVGFFANINHQVTLLLCAFTSAGFLAARLATSSDPSRRGGGKIVFAANIMFLAAGVTMAGSMAGYGLLIPTAFATLLIYRRATKGPLTSTWKLGLGAVLLVFAAAAVFGPISNQSISDKFGEGDVNRRDFWETTLVAAQDSAPLGTGLGTFANVYRRYENPQQATGSFVNHAHNDYLEVWLELGVVGAVLVALSILWWLLRLRHVWLQDFRGANLARVGSVIIGIVLMHSLVDYPIRTAAIGAIFAAACALMVSSIARTESQRSREPRNSERARHLEAA